MLYFFFDPFLPVKDQPVFCILLALYALASWTFAFFLIAGIWCLLF